MCWVHQVDNVYSGLFVCGTGTVFLFFGTWKNQFWQWFVRKPPSKHIPFHDNSWYYSWYTLLRNREKVVLLSPSLLLDMPKKTCTFSENSLAFEKVWTFQLPCLQIFSYRQTWKDQNLMSRYGIYEKWYFFPFSFSTSLPCNVSPWILLRQRKRDGSTQMWKRHRETDWKRHPTQIASADLPHWICLPLWWWVASN